MTNLPNTADLPAMDVASRLGRLRTAMQSEPCDVLVVSNMTNIAWLSGFSGSAGNLIVSDSHCRLITDGRYAFQAPQEIAAAAAEVEVLISANLKEQKEMLIGAIEAAGAAPQVGLEAEHTSWKQQLVWAEMLGSAREPVPISGLVEQLRQRKDAGEVARIAQAAAMVDQAMQEIFDSLNSAAPSGQLGLTEQALAAELDYQIRRRGASELAFETIVAAGPNSALPHARPSTRAIQPGELLLIDVGAVYDGYRSDMTRTFAVGEPSKREVEIWQVVAEAQQLGVDAVRAGTTTGAIDRACRDRIADAGWGDAFMHSTGHGVGRDIHERPGVSANTTDTLRAGEVITVEPGIYLEGLAGVRIEDTVLVTEAGCEPLTKTPKFLTL